MSHSSSYVDPRDLTSRLKPMRGRDPHETGRVASTLELLFDLTFVVAIATGAAQLAHALGDGLVLKGVVSFLFTSFGIIWAWVNYSWFASAFDTDDWLYRLLTMLQMIGVVIFTLGIPQVFDSVHHGHLNNTIIVIGYVIMRVAMLCQWVRAYRSCPANRSTIRVYIVTLVVAQILWIPTTFMHNTHLPLWACFMITSLVSLIELAGPVIAERGAGTPWHAHHIAERHGLLTIIAIGEVVTGTVLTLSNIIDTATRHIDWTSAILVALSGIGLAFAMWWTYFITPFAQVLHRYRSRAFAFGYSHFLIWPAIAAVGGGLHVMALTFESTHQLNDHTLAAEALAVPVGVYVIGLFLAHYWTTRFWAILHTLVISASVGVLVVAVLLAHAGANLAVVLAVITVVPWITVGAFELHDGAKHEAQILTQLYEEDDARHA